ncbi:MFS transporter [Pullulanibacillus sp. KACC 23026]|uniref:MFS transporter n=1 Tax=Pullulanibacillus sp. KACC 23026 TaxID=3028315 RepID=UPI0023B145BB|nr:MFS transporter [Pullulanibacillus sp. KACC 23026]WEG14516.1 MFS transporter [Pullulanibacillus sp. KACC 23026]
MKKQVLLIIALFIASLNLRPAINSVSPLMGNINGEIGMSAAVASLLTSIPVICMGVFSPIAIKVSGKWGVERIIGWSLMIIGIGTVLRLWTHSTPLLLITSLIAGIGIAMIGPLLSGFIKLHFPKHVPSMLSVYTVALTLGAAASSSFSIPLQKSFHSWQASLAFWATIAFLAAIIWWLFVNLQVKQPDHKDSESMKVKLPWGERKAWLITLSFGLMAILFYSYTAWLPQIIQGMGYSKSYAATSLTIFVVIQIPVSLVLPSLLKKFPSRRLWLVTESIFELLGLVLLVFNVEPWLASALIGIGASGLFSLNLLLPIDATNHHHEAAAWSAKAQSVGYVIGALGPILLGLIHDSTNSFTSAVIAMIVIVLLMISVQFAVTAKRRTDHIEEQQGNVV